jgi:hypothetical protein
VSPCNPRPCEVLAAVPAHTYLHPAYRHIAPTAWVLWAVMACVFLSQAAFAQTQLRPPQQLGQPPQSSPGSQFGQTPLSGQLLPPATTATAPAALQAPLGRASAARPPVASNVVGVRPTAGNLSRFQTVTVGNQVVDLRTLRDTDVLKGSNGKTISVARIKQLQARIDGASSTPMVVAKPGQSLKTLAAAPPDTRVVLPGGRVARAGQLASIAQLRDKLTAPHVAKPVPHSAPSAVAKAVVGQDNFTLAQAMKSPGGDVIQVGTHKYTADQLRQIDTLLRASPSDPRGLLERVAARPTGSNTGTRPLPVGPRVAVNRSTPFQEMLSKPDATVLQTPGGKTATVGQIKAYMAKERLSVQQLEQKFRGAK